MVPDGWTAEDVKKVREWAVWNNGPDFFPGNRRMAARFVLDVLDAEADADPVMRCPSLSHDGLHCAEEHGHGLPHRSESGVVWAHDDGPIMSGGGEVVPCSHCGGRLTQSEPLRCWDCGTLVPADADHAASLQERLDRERAAFSDLRKRYDVLKGTYLALVDNPPPCIPIPDGWEPDGWRVPEKGESYLLDDGIAAFAADPPTTPRLVLRLTEPDAREALARALWEVNVMGVEWAAADEPMQAVYHAHADRLIADHADTLRRAAEEGGA